MYFEDFVTDTVIIGWLRDPRDFCSRCVYGVGVGGRNQGVDARGCELISNLIPTSLSPDNPYISSYLSSLQCVSTVNLSSPEGSSGSYQAAGPALGLITEKGQWGIPVVVIESLLRFGLVCIVALTVVTGIQWGLEITGSVVRL